ncbi:MAG: hypothetical protein CL583_05170 [Alteromonadaceae bacterium]|nr:hypothetical protein [Alteromonadaceae bacterium]|tara:strand:+ start:3707 stop:4705 length:999 start_codon:yes stop_codon:yes gene_type:complete
MIFSFFNVGLAHAAPEIQGVEGQLRSGQEITVKGTGFSEVSSLSIVKDSADKALVNDHGRLELTETGLSAWHNNEHTQWSTPLAPIVDKSDSGTVYKGVGRSYNQYLGSFPNNSTRSLFVSWDYKPSHHPAHSAGSNKFIRIWDQYSGQETRISWTQMHMIYSDATGETKPTWGGWPGTPGEWNQMEVWVDSDSGRITASVNGRIVHDVNDFSKVPNGIGLNIRIIGFDPSVGDPYREMETMLDNIYVSTEKARIVISADEEWENAKGNNTVQVPLEWSSTEITFKLDPERLDVEKPHYLYVIDKDGSANSIGYRLCAACPGAPPSSSIVVE